MVDFLNHASEVRYLVNARCRVDVPTSAFDGFHKIVDFVVICLLITCGDVREFLDADYQRIESLQRRSFCLCHGLSEIKSCQSFRVGLSLGFFIKTKAKNLTNFRISFYV